MSYYVYESYPHNKAIVHKGNCQYCRNGTDRQGTRTERDGSWLGPYATHEKAVLTAALTKRARQSSCKYCISLSCIDNPKDMRHGK